MTFFFDHNLSPNLADALNLLGINTTYLRKEFPPNIEDPEWMKEAAARGYIVITCDCNIQKRKAERQVYHELKLRGIFLAKSFSHMKVLDQAKWLLWRWEDILNTLRHAKPGTAYLLHQRGKLERL